MEFFKKAADKVTDAVDQKTDQAKQKAKETFGIKAMIEKMVPKQVLEMADGFLKMIFPDVHKMCVDWGIFEKAPEDTAAGLAQQLEKDAAKLRGRKFDKSEAKELLLAESTKTKFLEVLYLKKGDDHFPITKTAFAKDETWKVDFTEQNAEALNGAFPLENFVFDMGVKKVKVKRGNAESTYVRKANEAKFVKEGTEEGITMKQDDEIIILETGEVTDADKKAEDDKKVEDGKKGVEATGAANTVKIEMKDGDTDKTVEVMPLQNMSNETYIQKLKDHWKDSNFEGKDNMIEALDKDKGYMLEALEMIDGLSQMTELQKAHMKWILPGLIAQQSAFNGSSKTNGLGLTALPKTYFESQDKSYTKAEKELLGEEKSKKLANIKTLLVGVDGKVKGLEGKGSGPEVLFLAIDTVYHGNNAESMNALDRTSTKAKRRAVSVSIPAYQKSAG